MKKILKNNAKTAAYLNSLPTMYIVGCWAGYGVWDFPWSGKWEKNPYSGHMEPLVWYYDDHNGIADNWYLVPIRHVTSGEIICWTENDKVACQIASALNLKKEFDKHESLVR